MSSTPTPGVTTRSMKKSVKGSVGLPSGIRNFKKKAEFNKAEFEKKGDNGSTILDLFALKSVIPNTACSELMQKFCGSLLRLISPKNLKPEFTPDTENGKMQFILDGVAVRQAACPFKFSPCFTVTNGKTDTSKKEEWSAPEPKSIVTFIDYDESVKTAKFDLGSLTKRISSIFRYYDQTKKAFVYHYASFMKFVKKLAEGLSTSANLNSSLFTGGNHDFIESVNKGATKETTVKASVMTGNFAPSLLTGYKVDAAVKSLIPDSCQCIGAKLAQGWKTNRKLAENPNMKKVQDYMGERFKDCFNEEGVSKVSHQSIWNVIQALAPILGTGGRMKPGLPLEMVPNMTQAVYKYWCIGDIASALNLSRTAVIITTDRKYTGYKSYFLAVCLGIVFCHMEIWKVAGVPLTYRDMMADGEKEKYPQQVLLGGGLDLVNITYQGSEAIFIGKGTQVGDNVGLQAANKKMAEESLGVLETMKYKSANNNLKKIVEEMTDKIDVKFWRSDIESSSKEVDISVEDYFLTQTEEGSENQYNSRTGADTKFEYGQTKTFNQRYNDDDDTGLWKQTVTKWAGIKNKAGQAFSRVSGTENINNERREKRKNAGPDGPSLKKMNKSYGGVFDSITIGDRQSFTAKQVAYSGTYGESEGEKMETGAGVSGYTESETEPMAFDYTDISDNYFLHDGQLWGPADEGTGERGILPIEPEIAGELFGFSVSDLKTY